MATSKERPPWSPLNGHSGGEGRRGWRRRDGLGDGGQPLLSASIRQPGGDVGAGKAEAEEKESAGWGVGP